MQPCDTYATVGYRRCRSCDGIVAGGALREVERLLTFFVASVACPALAVAGVLLGLAGPVLLFFEPISGCLVCLLAFGTWKVVPHLARALDLRVTTRFHFCPASGRAAVVPPSPMGLVVRIACLTMAGSWMAYMGELAWAGVQGAGPEEFYEVLWFVVFQAASLLFLIQAVQQIRRA